VEERVALGVVLGGLGDAVEGEEQIEELGVHLPSGEATPTVARSSRRRVG
jgi:hypothetical protein